MSVGWTGVKEDWHALPFHLASFGHRVLVYDHREFGESRAPRLKEEKANETTVPKEKLTLELLADDCAELTRHVFPQQKVHCMGISSQSYQTQQLIHSFAVISKLYN